MPAALQRQAREGGRFCRGCAAAGRVHRGTDGYRPTVTLTFAPGAKTLPGLGLCFMTRPLLPLPYLTEPILQPARRRAVLLCASFLPPSLGTTRPR